MPGSTTRMSIPYPVGGDAPNVDQHMKDIADRVDAVAVMYGQGVFADRPVSTGGSPGKQGRIYFATDQNRHYWDTGTSWVPLGSAGWQTGDYKTSAATADHADPQGGMWLKCDSSAIDGAFTALIAMVGSNRPDARGRTAVFLGSNAAVNAIGDSDGVTEANRRPQHRHTPHLHDILTFNHGYTGGGSNTYDFASTLSDNGQDTGLADGGSGVVTDPLDTPAYIVVGNLFIHT